MSTVGTLRDAEWQCLCPTGGSIRAWSVSTCPRCGVSRPDTASIKAIVLEARLVQEALDEFDRLSPKYGRFTAMSMVLARYGGNR